MIDHFGEFKTYFELIHDDNHIHPLDDNMLVSTYSIASSESKQNKMYNKHTGPTGGEQLYLDWTNSPLVLK